MENRLQAAKRCMTDTFPPVGTVSRKAMEKTAKTAQYKNLGFHKSKKVKGMFKHRLKLDLQMMDCKFQQA